ncbi:Pro-Pol polyprotein [Araneus ventricosus]|uniref:Pro-Pol polyprotein n=1 Tax=Araneus ventricosus TaxID=182803 RepID=A0A4Y2QKN7_ARAVE|nr:Pro-Pol polyprotein [Araneus ventricosus]
MTHVDALSRSPIDIFCISFDNILPRLKSAQDSDNEVKAIKELLRISAYEDYCDRNGILYKFVEGKELVVVCLTTKSRENHIQLRLLYPDKSEKRKEGGSSAPVTTHTYHIDHLGPLESTNKNDKYVLPIIDAFTKFVWIYPTKSTTSAEVIAKLEIQKAVFGSPFQIISDRRTAFTSGDFADYCAKEKIKHHAITTGLPRANGQIERINQTIISVLSKLSLENPNKWYKFTNELQQTINSTYQRSIDTTPFELLFGAKMNTGGLDKLKEMVEADFQASFEAQREELRKHAKQQIFKIQEEKPEAVQFKKTRTKILQSWRSCCHQKNSVWTKPETQAEVFWTLQYH